MGTEPESVVDDHLSKVEKGAVVLSGEMERQLLMMGIFQQGWYEKFLGKYAQYYPSEMLEKVKSVPPVLIIHGIADNAVELPGSERFVAKMTQVHPDIPVLLDTQPGDHAFDQTARINEEGLMKDVEFIAKYWLSAS
jgi:fermentation-respiration switch protein FrsA (DUF1100 family)